MMKRLLILIIALLCAAPAAAMTRAGAPAKFSIPFANSAGTGFINYPIPTPSQIGVLNCAASLTDGFPPKTMQSASAGGCPPFGQDFNGILKQVTQWNQQTQAGAVPIYDSAFSSSIGGYPEGSVLSNASTPSCFWISEVDNNTSNPDSGGANWLSSCPGGGATGTSSGTNAQTVTVNPFVLAVGTTVTFKAGGSNTSALTINVNGIGSYNVFRRSQLGASLTVGGEIVSGQMITLQWDGSEWQCISCEIAHVGQEYTFTNTVPAGYQVEDGSCISQSTYADLYGYYGSTDLWKTQAGGGSCAGGYFHVALANGRLSVAANNQGSGTGPLTNCTAGLTNNCGTPTQALSSTGQLPIFTPSGTITGSQSFTAFQNTAPTTYGAGGSFGTFETITIQGSNFGFSGNSIGSVSPSSFSIVNPNYQVYKAVKL